MHNSKRLSLAVLAPLVLAASSYGQQGPSYVLLAEGCPGTLGIPHLESYDGTSPYVGTTFTALLTNTPNNGVALGIIGLSSTDWAGFALPLDLSVLNMPGCFLYTDIRRTTSLTLWNGPIFWELSIPNTPDLIGVSFFQQVFILNGFGPGIGSTMSDAYEGVIGSSADIRLDTDPAGTARSLFPQIASSGDAVYVVWEDGRELTPGVMDPGVYFNRSLDSGATWLPSDLRVDTDRPGTRGFLKPQIAAFGDSVYVTWMDERDGATDIYFNRSFDAGATWMPSDLRLDPDQPGSSFSTNPQIAISGDSVYVTWFDRRNGLEDIYFNRSLDRGATWLSSDLRLNTDPAGSARSWTPRIAVSGSSVYVTWEDFRVTVFTESDIYLNRSLDGGATWLAVDVRMDSGLPGVAASEEPQIAAAGNSVYVIWVDWRNGVRDVYLNRSIDGGVTFQSSDRKVNTEALGISNPRIAAAGSAVYVTWGDRRNGKRDIYFDRSLDNGASWLSANTRLDTDIPGIATSRRQAIAVSGNSVHVTWWDDRNAGSGEIVNDIYFNQSFDGGTTWLNSDLKLDEDTTRINRSYFPEISSSNDNAYVTWNDDRNGDEDIYFRRVVLSPTSAHSRQRSR